MLDGVEKDEEADQAKRKQQQIQWNTDICITLDICIRRIKISWKDFILATSSTDICITLVPANLMQKSRLMQILVLLEP